MNALGLFRTLPAVSILLLALAACGDDGPGGLDASVDGGTDGGPTSCTSNDDCPSGWSCDLTDNVCLDPSLCPATPCGPGQDCSDEGMCEPRACTEHDECGVWVCIEGMCAEPPDCSGGETCPGDLECNTGSGVCEEPDMGCMVDEDCGQAVLYTCENGVCLNNCLGDDNCGMNEICEERPMAASVCVDAECTANSDCNEGAGERCDGLPHGRCIVPQTCTDNSDCDPGSFCNEDDECEALPTCSRDTDCPGTAYCENGACQPTDSCASMSCADGFDCVADICVPAVCRNDAECTTAGEVCVAGECVPEPSAGTVTEVRILTPASVVTPGGTVQFTALALDASGNPVAGIPFTWASGSTNVATIDAAGLATGGNTVGTSSISASVDTGSGTITSPGVDLTNVGDAQNVRRVTVVNARTGAFIQGATVTTIDGQGNASDQTTDASGAAQFPAQVLPDSITVRHDDYDWVTVIGVSGDDILVRLTPATLPNRTAGVRGTSDLSQITTMGAVEVALSGASFASPLNRFSPASFFGGDTFRVSLMVTDVDLPTAITASAEVFGFPVTLQDTFHARAAPGLRMPWSFGGKVELADLGIGGGGGGGNFLTALLGRFQSFKHDLVSPRLALDLAFVVDSQDINGNGDTSEEVPDFNNFTQASLQPSVEQSLRFQVQGGASLPTNTDALVLLTGILKPGVGLVPLGIDGAEGSAGSIATFSTRAAPAHSGAEGGTYVVMALAVPLASGQIPNFTSARMVVADSLPGQVDLSAGWLELPTGSFDAQNRTLTSSASPGADAWRARFESDDGVWEVYGPTAVETFELPDVGNGDRSQNAGLTLDALDLDTNIDLDVLFDVDANGDPILMDRATTGFAQNPLITR